MTEKNQRQILNELEQETKVLIHKTKKGLRNLKLLRKLKEPVLILIRGNNKAQVFQGIKSDELEFKHTDKSTRYFDLRKGKIELPIGLDSVTCYICHEDHAYPLNIMEPTISSEQYASSKARDLSIIGNWKAKDKIATGKLIKAIAIAIGIIIAVLILGYIIAPDFFTEVLGRGAKETTQVIIQNSTAVRLTG